MVKRNKLYTVNKWNRPAFMPANIYDGETMGTQQMTVADMYGGWEVPAWSNPVTGGGNRGVNYSGQNTSASPIVTRDQYQGINFSLIPSQNTTVNTDTGSKDAAATVSTGKPLENVDYTAVDYNSISNPLGQTLTSAQQYTPLLAEAAKEGSSLLSSSSATAGMAGTLSGTAANAGTFLGRTAMVENSKNLVNGFASQAAANWDKLSNPFANKLASPALSSTASSTAGAAKGLGTWLGADKLSSLESAGIGIGSQLVGTGAKSLISNGLQTSTGDTIANVGNLVGGVASAFNPVVGGIVTLAGNVVGGVVNAGWGHKVFGKGDAKNYLNQMSGFSVNSDSADSIEQAASQIADPTHVTYKDGWFTNKGKKEAASLNKATQAANDFAWRSVTNAAANNAQKQQQDLLASYAAYGGPIATRKKRFDYGGPLVDMINNNEDMGAVEYGLMTDYLTSKDRQVQAKDKVTTSPVGFGTPKGLFSLGGTMQAGGSNWGNVTQVNTGSSHEENPYDGVQMGKDSEGTPNLVEEGECIWNDYVFSNRLVCPKDVRTELGVRGKKDMSFADVAKKLTKESEERPNDPISKAALNALMEDLAEAQETFKKEREAARAKAEFDALSPEEQTAVMQQRAAQEQAMQQQAMQQQAMAQQAQAQGISPEQMAMEQQQGMEQQEAQPSMNAYGGKLYADGGLLDFLKSLGYNSTMEAAEAGWKPEDFGLESWSNVNSNTKVPDSFSWNDGFNSRVSNIATKAALSQGWRPGAKAVKRQWNENVKNNKVGWTASHGKKNLNADEFQEYVDRYPTIAWAVKHNLLTAPEEGKTIATADIARAMSQAPDWKATDKWLFDDADAVKHQAEYLGLARAMSDQGDSKFDDYWKNYGTFSLNDDDTYTFNLNDSLTADQLKEFTDRFRRSRTDGDIGLMYNSFVNPTQNNTKYAIDDKGNVVGVLADTSGYEQVGEAYNWGDPDNFANNSATYYRAKADAANPASGDGAAEGEGDDTEGVAPKHRWEGLRYAGLIGPAAGLGLWAAGVGKPDTSGLDAAVSASSVSPIMADYKPIGDYLKYRPFDRDYYINKLNAESGASRRTLLNSGSTPQRAAAILAADNQYIGKIGDLARQAEEYNLAQREKVATFNRGTNQYNADAYNRAALQYASDYNNQKRYAAQMAMEAAKLKMDADSQWNQGLYAGITNLANAASAIGKENATMNQISRMGANGIFGTMDPNDNALGSTILKEQKKGKKSADGGRINRKRRGGLTY